MNSNYMIRPLLWGAIGAGVADVVIASCDLLGSSGVVDNAQPAPLGYVEQAVVVAGDVCFLLGWLALGRVFAERARWGRSGRAGVFLALLAGGLILVANTLTLVSWRVQLVPLHLFGFLLWFVGSVMVAVAGWRCDVLPRWLLAVFAICPIVVWGGPVGQYAYGAVWMMVGAVLLRGRRRGVEPRSSLSQAV